MIKNNHINQTSIKQRVLAVVAAGLALVVGAGLFIGSNSVQAQQASETNTANTLKVSPVRTDIEINPGESKTVQTTVTNLTDAPIVVRAVTNDFIAGDERGTPALILDENEFAKSHSLKRFMEPLGDVTIPAKKSETVTVTINVPADARPGGYFGAIRFAPATPDDGGQVNLSASVASLILMSVPGETTEKLELTDFDIQKGGESGSYFIDPAGLQASVRFKSSADVQLGPIGKISVKKGDKVVYDTDFNNKTPRDMILPDSARRWEVPIENVDNFGKYTVSATFTYGQKNQTIEVTKSFWVIPMWVILTAAVSLLVLIGLVIGLWQYVRRRKRRMSRGFSSRR